MSCPDIVSGTAARDEHGARPEEFTSLRQLDRDAENDSVLVGIAPRTP
jgi:hypothetical protein